jgi:hypothetical protein
MPFSISTKFSSFLASSNHYNSNGRFLFLLKLYAIFFLYTFARKFSENSRGKIVATLGKILIINSLNSIVVG